jgi:hypothetical protein
MILQLLCLLWVLLLPSPAQAMGGLDPGVSLSWLSLGATSSDAKAADNAPTEEEKAKAAEEDQKKKEKLSRVIVLRWKGTTADFHDTTLQRNVRSRIDRSDAMFFPEVDLYQNGRKLMDKTVVPALQPAIVPDENIPQVLAAVNAIASVPYKGLKPHEWGMKAQELQRKVELLWFVDRPALREPLFLLYLQIGRAAENQNNPSPPFFEQIGSFSLNYYYYLAAVLAQQDPALMTKITDPDAANTVKYYLSQLQQGAYPVMKIDFELDDKWNGEDFAKTYEILFNGLPVEPDENAQISVFLGRTDIYLRRKDSGHGLSERLEVNRLEDKFYPVVQNARKRMGIDFIDQLFLHPNECSPELDGDILNYLSIYAKLHSKSEIYIAVPQEGNPNKTWIWRYDRKEAKLSLVGGGPDSFPVRFAFLASVGALYNGISPTLKTDTPPVGSLPSTNTAESDFSYKLADVAIPLNLELRAHYNRLMVNLGAELGFNATGGEWQEHYQTPDDTIVLGKKQCAEGDTSWDCTDADVALNTQKVNRYLYFGSAVVFGRDAGIGFGPRLGFRFGWTNLPHALVPTLNAGWAIQPSFLLKGGGRVRPLIDIDLRGGLGVPFGKHLTPDMGPIFGGTLGAGLTF